MLRKRGEKPAAWQRIELIEDRAAIADEAPWDYA
jgi:hypothetical protein